MYGLFLVEVLKPLSSVFLVVVVNCSIQIYVLPSCLLFSGFNLGYSGLCPSHNLVLRGYGETEC